MNEFTPGLIVLAIGLVAGGGLALRLRRSAGYSRRGSRLADLQLEAVDLEERRQQLYEALRESHNEALDEGEKHRLELSAARSLKALEGTRRSLEKRRPKRAKGTTTSAEQIVAPTSSTRSAMVGFAFGAAMVALVAVLFFWAGRDASPVPEQAAPGSASAGGEDLAQLDPQVATRVRAMREKLRLEPTNLDTRKALAETLISEGVLFEGYQETQRILQQSPGDADGLYLQGLVRLMMGQSETAVELLDRALAEQPEHVSAYLVRGLARLRLGSNKDAISDWERGLAASGGSHPGLERLLEMARAGKGAEEILGVSASARTDPSPPSGRAFSARVELAFGANPVPGSVLFVFLRNEDPGPPAAVRRIDNPTFPTDLSLDDSHSMLGRPLPEEGTLSARLDVDGDASTRDPGDLAAEAPTRRGETVVLVLRP